MKKINRRDFLKYGFHGSALAMSPLNIIANLILSGAHNRSYAAEGQSPRYFLIHQPYAPSRWMFDLLLNPFGDPNFKANRQMGTALNLAGADQRYSSAQYKLERQGGIDVPPIWGFNLPTSTTGSTRKLAALIPNMLHLRGIDTKNPSHEISKDYLFAPVGATKTVSALASETSSDPIPGVALHPQLIANRVNTYNFKSSSGASGVILNDQNYIKQLTDAFSWPEKSAPKGTEFEKATGALQQELAKFQADIDKELSSGNPQYNLVLGSRRDMRTLLSSGFGDPVEAWNRLLAKYRQIIRATLSGKSFPGINDQKVGAAPGAGRQVTHLLNNMIPDESDLRTILDPDSVVVRGMAELFAAAEYIFVNNLSSSVVGNHEHIIGITNSKYPVLDPDQHFWGSVTTTYFNTMMFSALGACLLEFVETLKSKGLFDSSLIEIASEFNRTPKAADGGADHGFEGASSIMFSGAIKGPIIIGNIQQEDTAGNYAGSTWGKGAPNAELGGSPLSPSQRASTIASFFGVPSPTASARSTIKKERDGKIVAATNVQPGRIVSQG